MGHYWSAYLDTDTAGLLYGVEGDCWVAQGGFGPSLSWRLFF